MGEAHQLQLLRQEDGHVLELAAGALPVVDRADLQVKPAELDLLSSTVNEKCLVHTLVILTHYEESVVFRGRERQQRLQLDVQLPIPDVNEVEARLKRQNVTPFD